MEIISRKACRLCLVETDFNISLFSNYCRKTNMIDKILVTLKIVIEETDALNTICFKCAGKVEEYYNFITTIKKSQTKMANNNVSQQSRNFNIQEPSVTRHVTSYVREQVIDEDLTFSFLDSAKDNSKKEAKASSPFFSYFSPPSMKKNDTISYFAPLKKTSEPVWKTPRLNPNPDLKKDQKHDKNKNPVKTATKSKQLSGDLFESQSQDEENNADIKDWSDWKFTPDSGILKRVRDKCFGRQDF